MKRALLIAICALGFTVTGAAQNQGAGPAASVDNAQQATVYFYRYKQFVGSGLTPSVYCDDQELARMDNGRYFAVRLDAGKHSLRSNDKQASIDLETKAGQNYYIRIEIAPGMMKGHGRVVLMSPEQGASEIKRLKPLDASDVRDRDRVVTEVASAGV